ncbi:ion channel POLLUX-like 1 isoform X4 [Canna indica]|uniref:Ion channel POLLUX-like 1 isoform X4 n=1 Tax=Canna indica TaxID=4628 RepID=A0AAQ3KHD9_9LILI|nr:ion channel POLLUX-like 1 isoform X4 [Canna indica]
MKILLQSVSFYLSKLAWSSSIQLALVAVFTLPKCGSTLPFACLYTSTNKPIPLHLNVSFLSFKDLKWSISRLYFLFNTQLERNIGLISFNKRIIKGLMLSQIYEDGGENGGEVDGRKNEAGGEDGNGKEENREKDRGGSKELKMDILLTFMEEMKQRENNSCEKLLV